MTEKQEEGEIQKEHREGRCLHECGRTGQHSLLLPVGGLDPVNGGKGSAGQVGGWKGSQGEEKKERQGLQGPEGAPGGPEGPHLADEGELASPDVVAVQAEGEDGSQGQGAAHGSQIIQVGLGVLDVTIHLSVLDQERSSLVLS